MRNAEWKTSARAIIPHSAFRTPHFPATIPSPCPLPPRPHVAMKALILVTDGFEDLTLFLPWSRLREEGFTVRLAAPLMHALTGLHGYRVEPDERIHEVNPADYDAVVVPDGPCVEKLRQREAAVDV